MSDKYTLAVACLLLFTMGLLTSALGPALPDLADHTGRSLAELGALFTAIFMGALLAQSVSGPLNDRAGQRPVLVGASVFVVVGSIGVVLSPSLIVLLAAGTVIGVGYGAIDVTTSVLVAGAFSGRSVSALNLLHMFFGIGAVSGPAIASLSLRLADTALPPIWIAACVMVVAVPLALRLPRSTATVPTHEANTAASPAQPAARLYGDPLLWAIGVLILLYVGIETGVGGWTTAYIERSTTFNADTAALVTSGFWLALTGGRVLGTIFGTRLGSQWTLWLALGGAALGGLVLAMSTGSILFTVVGVLLIGLSYGPVFPTIVSITTDVFRHGPGKATGAIVAMGSIGGVLIPWTQGVLLDRVSLSAMVIFVAACNLAMLLVYIGIRAARRHWTPASAAAPLATPARDAQD